MKQRPKKQVEPDPFFQEVPSETHRDASGDVIGEVFMLPIIYLNQGLLKRSEKQNERTSRK